MSATYKNNLLKKAGAALLPLLAALCMLCFARPALALGFNVEFPASPQNYTITDSAGGTLSGTVNVPDSTNFYFVITPTIADLTPEVKVDGADPTLVNVAGDAYKFEILGESNTPEPTKVVTVVLLCNATLTPDAHASLAADNGYSAARIVYGGDFKFIVSADKGYTPTVKVGNATQNNPSPDTTGAKDVYKYTVTPVTTNLTIEVTTTANTYTVTLPANTANYTLSAASPNPVSHDGTVTFNITPIGSYANNTTEKPIVTANAQGSTAQPRQFAVVWNAGKWECTLANVTSSINVTISTGNWTAPLMPLITFTGTGFDVANFLNGTLETANQYRLNAGATTASFSINVRSGYNSSSLVVSAGGVTLTPANGVYTLSNITANVTVTVSLAATTAAPTASSSSSLKHYELVDDASGVVVSGFFLGTPVIKVSALLPSDRVFIRMMNSAKTTQDKVLYAWDIEVTGASYYGTIRVCIGVGPGYNTTPLRLIHGTDYGDEVSTVIVKNSQAQINVRSLSPFMVVDPYGTGTAVINTNTSTGISPPRTGDSAGIFGFVLLGAALCGIVFLVWYRKRKVKLEED